MNVFHVPAEAQRFIRGNRNLQENVSDQKSSGFMLMSGWWTEEELHWMKKSDTLDKWNFPDSVRILRRAQLGEAFPATEDSICQAACAHSARRGSKWSGRDPGRGEGTPWSSCRAWSINHPALKLQSVGRFQLRASTCQGWALCFPLAADWGAPTGLINNEFWGGRRPSLDPLVPVWAQHPAPPWSLNSSESLSHWLLWGSVIHPSCGIQHAASFVISFL